MVRDACIGAGQRICHAIWLPLRHILDNFVSSQVNSLDSLSLEKKNKRSFMLREHVQTIDAAVENDIFCISQGTAVVDRFENN